MYFHAPCEIETTFDGRLNDGQFFESHHLELNMFKIDLSRQKLNVFRSVLL